MKKLLSLTVVFCGLWLTSCDSSKVAEQPVAASPSASTTPASSVVSASPQGAATITASPNPVPAGTGMGTTKITWSTGDGTVGQVYVAVNGADEAIFAAGNEGSTEAPWIQEGQTYEFRLYAGTEHTKVLAKTEVTRAK